MEGTKIQWAHHTWNPWRGCAKVSEGCDHCYAEAMSVRNPGVLGTWGPGGLRPLGNASYWQQPHRWNRAALARGESARVFCGSLMDIFEERSDLVAPRRRVFEIADETQWLSWLFLTKRAHNIGLMTPAGRVRPNWWFGCTVENQDRAAERIPELLAIPARIRWLSVEPLLESVDLTQWLATGGIHWVIVGGESNQGGVQARPFDLVWAEEIVTQCRSHNVPVFVKQMGSRPIAEGLGLRLRDRHGGDPEEWPEWMRVREVPT